MSPRSGGDIIREASFWAERLCGGVSTSMAKSVPTGDMEDIL